jgi:hypothetical protein
MLVVAIPDTQVCSSVEQRIRAKERKTCRSLGCLNFVSFFLVFLCPTTRARNERCPSRAQRAPLLLTVPPLTEAPVVFYFLRLANPIRDQRPKICVLIANRLFLLVKPYMLVLVTAHSLLVLQ